MQETQKLIIIDDEKDLLDLMAYNFSRKGYEVFTFSHAQRAWDFLEETRPDLILCDWMMPEISGLDFCKRVKGNLQMADIPFVMFTCRSEKSAEQQALAEGVSAFIRKPIPIPELVNKVSHIFQLQAP